MLPLEKLTPAATLALESAGYSLDDVTIVTRMDLDFSGNFGEGWLVFSEKKKQLIRLLGDPDSIKVPEGLIDKKTEKERVGMPEAVAHSVSFHDAIDLRLFTSPTVDNFASSNRLVYLRHATPAPDTEGMDDEQKKAVLEEWNSTATSEIVAYCTNSKKRYLFTFVDVSERISGGGEVSEDDQIFEQYHAKCPKCGKEYDDQLRKICSDCNQRGQIVRRLLGYIKPYKWHYVLVFTCMLAVAGLNLLSPVVNGHILYDYVIDVNGKWHSMSMLLVVLTCSALITLSIVFINILHSVTSSRIGVRIHRDIKMDLFSSLERLSLSYYNNNPTGRLITRISTDPERIQGFLINGLTTFVLNVFIVLGLSVFLFIMNWKLTLILFTPIPLIVIIFKVMLPRFWKLITKSWRATSALNAMLNDSLTGVRVVKAFAKEAEETNRFYKFSTRVYESTLKVNIMGLTIFPLVSLLIGITSTAIWGFGGIEVMGDRMEYGEFCTYLGYIGLIFGPLQFFTNFTNLVTEAINSAQRIFEVMDATPDIIEASDAVELESINGSLEFDNVSFHYSPNRPILKNINIKINAGDNVGLVGHTGSGKSTIANLITRMYDPISGAIYLDGVDLRKIKTSCLRRNIAIVSQEIFIFRGTIADNIRYARPDAPMSEVIAAARAANAHDFITLLPNGYETEVGTGYRSLSGGERQRVSIARALLMSPSILILDEATAAMDTETERMIGEALSKLVEGRTSITIAHRLSTLKDCNYLFAIENGEIAEEGTPEDLLAKEGVYYKLYMLQCESMKRVLQGM